MTSTATPPQTLPETQLLELLVQLQKTTPDQARAILNAQPAIGYALLPLMVKLEILNLDVVQRTLSSYTGTQPSTTTTPAPAPPPVPSIPTHLTQQAQAQPPYGHHPTPPPGAAAQPVASTPASTSGNTGYPGYPPAQSQAQNGVVAAGAGAGAQQYPQQQYWNGQQTTQQPTQQSQQAAGTQPSGGVQAMLSALGNIPEEQREMVMRMISMTPEQIRNLSPQERAITIQLRATLGLPTE